MKNFEKITLFQTIGIVLLFTSCIWDEPRSVREEASGRETEVKITIQMPQSATSATYTLSETDENYVATIDIMAFKADASKASGWAFDYSAEGVSLSSAGTSQSRKQFTTTLITSSDAQTLVVLANARAEIAALRPAKGADKDALLERLISANAGKWDANEGKTETDPSKTFSPFPMWGEIVATITDATAQIAGISMLRAIARLDVVLDNSITHFKLDAIYVYNTKDRGQIVPAPAHVSSGKVTTATLPPGNITNVAPLIYNVPVAMNKAFERSIYLYEAKAAAQDKASEATCVIVGGTYASDATRSYYRLDFLDANRTNYRDLLRNHNYRIVIKDVSGRGYDTPGDAFNSKAMNMEVDVTVWDDGKMGDIVFDGQNYLSVGPAEFSLPRDAKNDTRFSVVTDVKGGWTITGATDSPQSGGTAITWIKNISGSSTGAGNKDVVSFDVEDNSTGATRTGYIHIQAGRLRFAVKIDQGADFAIGAWIFDATGIRTVPELIFFAPIGVQPSAQQFRVLWAPRSAAVSVSASPATNGGALFAYDTGSGNDAPGTSLTTIDDGSGNKLLTVQPTAITAADIATDPFLEKASRIDFTVASGGVYASQGLFLRQITYNIVPVADPYYTINGENYSFVVRSNTRWAVKPNSLKDPSGLLDLSVDPYAQSGGDNTSLQPSAGNVFYFKMTNDIAKNGADIEFILTDPTGRAADVPIKITGVICGKNGFASTQKIGNNYYKTHLYNGRCWMVQNSQEGTPAATMYDGESARVNGYYYTWEQATQTACPSGWRLPTDGELSALMNTVKKDFTGVGKWWAGSEGVNNRAFAGFCRGGTWKNWDSGGYWWGGEMKYRSINSSKTSITGLYTETSSEWFSVRCVKM
jgi:uncharacterized protein (TIGR02145 family)